MTGQEMYNIIKKNVGMNGAKPRHYCGMSGGAWCNAYVCYAFNQAGQKNLYYGGKKVTYCPTSIQWCKAHLAQIPPYLAMPCDIIYFDWNFNHIPDHIGFVKKKRTSTSVHTHEGNTDGGKVAEKVRTTKYPIWIFRPHFVPKKQKKSRLTIDGDFGYHSIFMLQVALNMKNPDGILTKDTVKKLQKKVGATADGVWLEKTSRAVQKWCGATQDGKFAKNSVKALQKKINSIVYPNTTESPSKPPTVPSEPTPQDKAIAWGRKIAKDGSYKYVLWTKDKKTHLCPVCHPELKGKYHGWQCIGFVTACWYHGAGLRCIKCECNGLGTNNFFTKVTEESWRKRNGKDWKMITNGGKKGGKSIPLEKLKAGDILICYDAKGVFHHIVMYTGNGMYIECTRGRKPQIGERPMSKLSKKHITRAFRYTGK